jgi:hypothetical protein
MGGETEHNVSGWTVDTLRAFFVCLLAERDLRYEQRLQAMEAATAARFADLLATHALAHSAQQQAVIAALTSADRAITKSEIATEKRFDAVNERETILGDQAAQLMPRAEADARLAAIAEKTDQNSKRIDRNEGRSGGLHAGWGYLIGVVGLIGGLLTILLAYTHH